MRHPVSAGISPSALRHVVLTIESHGPFEFIDITDRVAQALREMGADAGIVVLQTLHTTTGLLVNEHEPLLLADLAALFERMAPENAPYDHDDARRRTVNVQPAERRNGHAHCRAALLRTSEVLTVAGGVPLLGRWQRVFLVDFDGPQRRRLAVTFIEGLSKFPEDTLEGARGRDGSSPARTTRSTAASGAIVNAVTIGRQQPVQGRGVRCKSPVREIRSLGSGQSTDADAGCGLPSISSRRRL